MPSKLKTDDLGKPVYENGLPVFTNAEGKDIPIDVDDMTGRLTTLSSEAAGHRRARNDSDRALKEFEGIDPTEARKALKTVQGLSDKQLIDAGEAERVRAEIVKTYDEKLSAEAAKAGKAVERYNEEKIGGAFARSSFIVGDKAKTALPADLMRSHFGKHYSVDDEGNVVAKDTAGNVILSKVRAGLPADFDESIEMLVDSYPHKASILKGANQRGDGMNGVGGRQSGANNGKVIAKADFERLAPADRMAKMNEGFVLAESLQ